MVWLLCSSVSYFHMDGVMLVGILKYFREYFLYLRGRISLQAKMGSISLQNIFQTILGSNSVTM